jgi:hypothetical protein
MWLMSYFMTEIEKEKMTKNVFVFKKRRLIWHHKQKQKLELDSKQG